MPIILVAERDADEALAIRSALTRLGFTSDVRVVKEELYDKLSLATSPALRTSTPDVVVRIGGMTIDPASFSVVCGGRTVFLTRKEFLILHKLASNPGRAFTREQLFATAWGPDSNPTSHALDVHINRLRKQIGGMGNVEITTVRNVGYRLDTRLPSSLAN